MRLERPLLLASGSPRRRELLERIGIPLWMRPVDVDEAVRPGETPSAYLQRIVADKLAAARALADAGAASAILVADTTVVAAGAILGKPESDAEADAMLAALAGREHVVATRFCVARADDAKCHAETVETRVWFRDLDASQRGAYVASGEGRDKAGAYAIQGIGAVLVRRIEGSYTNVVGLPVCEVVEALEKLGLLPRWPMGS